MSIQHALLFIRRVRREPQLVAAIPPAELTEQLPALGRSLGCEFTLDELQTAFAHDWAMRFTTADHRPSTTDD
jgi:hypothetical protein